MRIKNYTGIVKQTAVLFVCGLLPMLVWGQQRSKAEIDKIVTDFSINKAKNLRNKFQMKSLSSQITPTTINTNTGEAFYIFTAKDDASGFVIVSGDRRMPNILAYSETNDFDINNIPPNVKYWLSTYADAYSQLDGKAEETAQPSDIEAYGDGVSPILGELRWSQGEPFNQLCPMYVRQRSVTGCVATAMAQVMKHYEYPVRGTGNVNYYTSTHHIHVSRNFQEKDFQWDMMLDDYSGHYSSAQADAVAELMYSCGASVKMDYDPSGSGAYQHDLLPAYINNFHYDSDAAILFREYCSTREWHKLLVKELNEGRPVNYAGSSISDGGHSFVLDGYRLSSTKTYPDYHVNWGWGGTCDGYYQIAALNPTNQGMPTMSKGFSEGQQMTIGVKPDDGVAETTRMLCTSELATSVGKVKRGEEITISANTLCNFSYRDFTGEIAVALIDAESGEIKGMTSHQLRRLSFLDDLSFVQYAMIIPDDINDGDYKIQLLSKCSDATEWSPVYSAKYPVVSVLSNEDVQPTNTSTVLACSELALSGGNKDIKIELFQLTNLLLEPFMGTLTILLTDSDNQILFPLGSSVQTEELGYMQIQLNSIRLNGGISQDLPDGTYHLYIGVRRDDEENYTFLKQYDPTLTHEVLVSDLKLNVVKKGSQVFINDQVFQCLPTSIGGIANNATVLREIYSLSGVPTSQNPSSGIFIFNHKKYCIPSGLRMSLKNR